MWLCWQFIVQYTCLLIQDSAVGFIESCQMIKEKIKIQYKFDQQFCHCLTESYVLTWPYLKFACLPQLFKFPVHTSAYSASTNTTALACCGPVQQVQTDKQSFKCCQRHFCEALTQKQLYMKSHNDQLKDVLRYFKLNTCSRLWWAKTGLLNFTWTMLQSIHITTQTLFLRFRSRVI